MKNAHSIDLRQGEHIVTEVRRHMFVFYTKIFTIFILGLLPLLFIVPAANAVSNILPGQGLASVSVVYLLFLLVLIIVFFFQWTDYYLDVWIITTERIFDIEQKGLFSREISVFQLERIQEVNVKIGGIIATFLKFGDVHIHTAGSTEDLAIKSADKPLVVKKAILDECDRRAKTINSRQSI